MVLWLSMLLACGGGNTAEEAPAKGKKGKKGKKAKAAKMVEKPAMPMLPVKIKPPFFAMPVTVAKGVVGEGTGRELIGPVHKGPFGPTDTLTLFYREQVTPEGATEAIPGLGLMVVVPEGETRAGNVLDVKNTAPVEGTPELVWVNAAAGWQPVLMIERLAPDGETFRENQAFTWTGKEFGHADLEPKIATMETSEEIVQAFY